MAAIIIIYYQSDFFCNKLSQKKSDWALARQNHACSARYLYSRHFSYRGIFLSAMSIDKVLSWKDFSSPLIKYPLLIYKKHVESREKHKSDLVDEGVEVCSWLMGLLHLFQKHHTKTVVAGIIVTRKPCYSAGCYSLRAYLHGTTLSHATSLLQAYDTNCFV